MFRMLDGSPTAANEVHNKRDDGKDQQQMNEEAADMQDEKSSKPKHNQYNRQYDEHKSLFRKYRFSRQARVFTGDKRQTTGDSLLCTL
jgi:hypothetical protein